MERHRTYVKTWASVTQLYSFAWCMGSLCTSLNDNGKFGRRTEVWRKVAADVHSDSALRTGHVSSSTFVAAAAAAPGSVPTWSPGSSCRPGVVTQCCTHIGLGTRTRNERRPSCSVLLRAGGRQLGEKVSEPSACWPQPGRAASPPVSANCKMLLAKQCST